MVGSTSFPPIPLETAQTARALFGNNNYFLVIGDQANALFNGINLQSPSGSSQKQTHILAMLYLTTILQHIEALPDRLVVDALRERVDWKYALHSTRASAQINGPMLCEFRRMASVDQASKQNLQILLERVAEIPQIAMCRDVACDADQVIAHVCRISRFASIWEAFNNALETLAIHHGKWLLSISLPHWYERYGHSQRNMNQGAEPEDQEAFAQEIGRDGFYLLKAIDRSEAQELAVLPEVTVLRKVWMEQFIQEMDHVTWRKKACGSCTLGKEVRRIEND